MDVSNVQSRSHEKELFVLPLQTEEKMGRGFHLCERGGKLKIKRQRDSVRERGSFPGERRRGLNRPVLVLHVCVQCSCLCVCAIRRGV